ncbi:MAG: ABC transporter substrate-binding protein, partial [Christensenellales bacterium]
MCRDGMYLDDDTVKFAPSQPEWKEFVTEMAKWYAEGLIDPDFAANNGTIVQNKMGSGIGGMTYGSLAGSLGRQAALVEESVGGNLVGISNPRCEDGTTYAAYPEYSMFHTNSGAVITTQSKHAVECAKWLDFRYGEIGHMMLNFGVEDLSYTMVDEYPTFTDLIYKNPDGLAYDVAIAKYSMVGSTLDSFVQDPRSFAQNSLPTQRQVDA